MKKIKTFQILIVIILLITAFYLGKLSMAKQFNNDLQEYIYQLEVKNNQTQINLN